MKCVLLAGGVGGAKLASGLAGLLPPGDLTVVVNTGDDFQHLGLHISPDLDTVTYTLAGLANPDTGWGIAGDTFAALAALERLGGPAWFRIGDKDLATHILRTDYLQRGLSLTQATARICEALGVRHTILPMTDDPVATKVLTDAGELDFQDYFVRRSCEPEVRAIDFDGIEAATATDEVSEALDGADAVVIAPSNPFVSIEPVLALEGLRAQVSAKPALAVSPIVGGRALKGPAAKMLAELGLDASAVSVAARYRDCIRGFVMDDADASLAPDVREFGLDVLVTATVMQSGEDRISLARKCLELAERLPPAVPQR